MKLAITDACIFIDLYELELLSQFFQLDLEIHTSLDVFNELYPSQQQLLIAFSSFGKLTFHSLTAADRIEIYNGCYPRSFSDNDKTVLHLAAKLEAIILSSDKNLRLFAKNKSIEYHGMLWIFDKLIERGFITYNEASEKLQRLINTNILYQNNMTMVVEMNTRLKKWTRNFLFFIST